MSLPSDVNADVDEAAREMGASKSAARLRKPARPAPEHVGIAAAMLVAFFGIAVLGPRLTELRRPRRQKLAERARRVARQARAEAAKRRDEARKMRDRAGHRLRRLGGGSLWPR